MPRACAAAGRPGGLTDSQAMPVTICPTIRPFNRPTLERQRQARVIEPAVHAELGDTPAVDEAAGAHVRSLDLAVGIRVEDVAAADGKADPAGQLVRKIEVRQRLGAEVLVVRRVGRVVILDRSIVCRPPESAEPSSLPTRLHGAFPAREPILEPVPIFGVQNAYADRVEVAARETVRHGLG